MYSTSQYVDKFIQNTLEFFKIVNYYYVLYIKLYTLYEELMRMEGIQHFYTYGSVPVAAMNIFCQKYFDKIDTYDF